MWQASLPYILAAIALQTCSVLSQAYVVREMLLAFGPRIHLGDVLQIILAASFATVFIPSAGLSGLALRTKYLGDNGYTVEASLFTFILESLGLGIALSILVTLALLQLALAGRQVSWQALGLLAGTVLLASVLLAIIIDALLNRDWPLRSLRKPLALVNRVLSRWGRSPLTTTTLEQKLGDLRRAVFALDIRARLRLLLGSLGRALGEALCLQMTLLALGQIVPLYVTIASHGLSAAVGCFSSAPGGLFVTDSSLPALLAQQGVPVSAAIAATLVFRLISFWVPRALGLGAWYNLEKHNAQSLH